MAESSPLKETQNQISAISAIHSLFNNRHPSQLMLCLFVDNNMKPATRACVHCAELSSMTRETAEILASYQTPDCPATTQH